jgi:hypothetical protein
MQCREETTGERRVRIVRRARRLSHLRLIY